MARPFSDCVGVRKTVWATLTLQVFVQATQGIYSKGVNTLLVRYVNIAHQLHVT